MDGGDEDVEYFITHAAYLLVALTCIGVWKDCLFSPALWCGTCYNLFHPPNVYGNHESTVVRQAQRAPLLEQDDEAPEALPLAPGENPNELVVADDAEEEGEEEKQGDGRVTVLVHNQETDTLEMNV